MAKRFTDSNKWGDDFFAELSPKYKLLWLYMLDSCDHAGLFKVVKKNINFHLDGEYDLAEILEIFKDKIIVVEEKLWFIPNFITFQYGNIDSGNSVHESVMKLLGEKGLLNSFKRVYKGLGNSSVRDKDKEQDKFQEQLQEQVKEQVQAQDKDIGGNRKTKKQPQQTSKFNPPQVSDIKEYCESRKNRVDPEKFFDYYQSKGWMIGKNKMKDWKAAVRTWEKNDETFGRNTRGSTKDGYYSQDHSGIF